MSSDLDDVLRVPECRCGRVRQQAVADVTRGGGLPGGGSQPGAQQSRVKQSRVKLFRAEQSKVVQSRGE